MTSATLASRIAGLQAINEAIERADRDEFLRLTAEMMHPDAEWRPLIVAVEGQSYRGVAGVAEFYDDLAGSFDVSYRDLEFRTFGDDIVVALEHMCLRGRESAIEQVYEIGVLYEFDGDRVRRAVVHDSQSDAIAAAEALSA